MKFLNCYDKDKHKFLPAFTDWGEVNNWLKQRDRNVGGLIVPALELFGFSEKDNSYDGVVINPGTIGWTMKKENIRNFLTEFK